MLVAEGAVDGAIDAIGVSVWDLAAVQVIVEEAGGTFTDFAASTASTAQRDLVERPPPPRLLEAVASDR